jgi:hypothetical protein
MEQVFLGLMWSPRTPVAVILCIYVSMHVKPRLMRQECPLRIDLIFVADYRNQLEKPTLLAVSRGCKAWIAVVL